MASKNVLKEALKNFEGTLILVSHDRDFLQGLTNMVYEFRDHRIKPYLGDIDFYLEERKVADFREVERKAPKETLSGANPDDSKNSGAEAYEARKNKRSLKNRLGALENRIQDLEGELAEIDHQLLMNYDQTIAEPDFFDRYQARKKKLESLMEEWEALSEKLEE
jgi:ATP-binding cassette subfamily F protein 3